MFLATFAGCCSNNLSFHKTAFASWKIHRTYSAPTSYITVTAAPKWHCHAFGLNWTETIKWVRISFWNSRCLITPKCTSALHSKNGNNMSFPLRKTSYPLHSFHHNNTVHTPKLHITDKTAKDVEGRRCVRSSLSNRPPTCTPSWQQRKWEQQEVFGLMETFTLTDTDSCCIYTQQKRHWKEAKEVCLR